MIIWESFFAHRPVGIVIKLVFLGNNPDFRL